MVQRLKSDNYDAIAERMISDADMMDMNHAILGMFTEGAECADAFKRYLYYGTDLDKVNLKEEVGDLMYYVQLMCQAGGFTLEEALDSNEAKLNERFGDKFSEDAAVNRDTDAEREILEGNTDFIYRDNTGHQPVPNGTLIDFEHADGEAYYNQPCGDGAYLSWGLDNGPGTIVKWRPATTF
jgi:NTP pyrophosphatase (non-canonical NTP hydrolase)